VRRSRPSLVELGVEVCWDMVVLHGLRQRLETLGDTVPVDYGYYVVRWRGAIGHGGGGGGRQWRGGVDVVAKLGSRGDPA
jgi:hypothetical protein